MLVLTTNAIASWLKEPRISAWPGLHILVVLPDSGYDRHAVRSLNDTYIIIEWLQRPETTAVLLCDLIGLLERRLHEDEGPLLYLDQQTEKEAEPDEPSQISPHAAQAQYDPAGRITSLILGDMIATSPLLPGLLKVLTSHKVGDALLIETVKDSFVWDDV